MLSTRKGERGLLRSFRYRARSLIAGQCCFCQVIPAGSAGLCPICTGLLPHLLNQCQRCALPLASPEDSHCPQCLSQPPELDSAYAAFLYGYPVNRMVAAFKYRNQLAAGRALSLTLAQHIAEQPALADVDYLLPVPMHWGKQLRRGFNQAELVARDLGKVLGLRLQANLIKARRRKAAQQQLDKLQRRRNLQGVFYIPANRAGAIAGRHILLVDDVITTGATLNTLAWLLKLAGAHRVSACALARVP
ncbi:ComF family protein [Biformimicrobium ophioploci]|uniref:ComF family protein n=1 Tax=Biformimicrobium ophioploci TaxID=3036711 RepID=A0ABQ6LUP6_9GAMM|nr:ComF family protein [Microbulbifer sp. NKW57]GMG85786.1 ComF family protein [Microbulbifer sp. NKW57]